MILLHIDIYNIDFIYRYAFKRNSIDIKNEQVYYLHFSYTHYNYTIQYNMSQLYNVHLFICTCSSSAVVQYMCTFCTYTRIRNVFVQIFIKLQKKKSRKFHSSKNRPIHSLRTRSSLLFVLCQVNKFIHSTKTDSCKMQNVNMHQQRIYGIYII